MTEDQREIIVRALNLYKAQIEAHSDLLYRYRVEEDTVSAIHREVRAIDEILEEI